jgi:hypothetical protein
MGKIISFIIFLNVLAFANQGEVTETELKQKCLSCHKVEQIPDKLINKRYLIKYSTNKKIEEMMFNYLQDPKQEKSIMPQPFFLKFPRCQKSPMDDDMLSKHIKAYVKFFDIKKRLTIEK